MNYINKAFFDFTIPIHGLDAGTMIIEHRYNKCRHMEFDVSLDLRGDPLRLRIFSPSRDDDIIEVAKFILEINNEIVPLHLDTIIFSYISTNRRQPVTQENGIMVVSLDTKEYTDMDCAYVAEMIATGRFKFESAFRYVKR